MNHIALTTIALLLSASSPAQTEHPLPESDQWLNFSGGEGPGSGKLVILIAADQEYRSEEAMPMMAHLLAERHGFHTTTLFGVNEEGLVDPTQKIRWQDEDVVHRIPGLEHLAKADLVVFFTRLITLPEEQRRHIHAYLDSGKPIVALRTANHGFLELDYQVKGKKVRFGEDVLGGSFRSHHGRWHQDSTRAHPVAENADHPILRGVDDVWGPSDVYRTYPEGGSLRSDCTPLLLGQPLTGRSPDDPPNEDLIALPVAWVTHWTGAQGKTARVFHSTMGSARDLKSAGLRRVLVNAIYWGLALEELIGPRADVEPIVAYEPKESGFDYAKLGVRPLPVAALDPRRREGREEK